MMDRNVWTQAAVVNAVLQDNANLKIVLSNYFKVFIERLGDYDIHVEDVKTIEDLHKKVVEGIGKLEEMRKEFLSVAEMLATSKSSLLERCLPKFLCDLLNHYEEEGVNLYTGTSADVIRNDHYRFFNQFLMISLTALLVENRCFKALSAVLHARFAILDKSLRQARELNFIRFRSYNYTLNEFLNTSSPKRISVTADYMMEYSSRAEFAKLIKADILLYYMSLWYHTDDIFDRYWQPELSVYNRENEILPLIASKAYFEEAKVLFDVKSITEYKEKIEQVPERLQRNGLYRVPLVKDGLLYDRVGSLA